ncbi:MAG: S-methyl-5-thioribose-1-phosphate isomerase [Bacteroidales bacterium]|jgi:methylthioribose-1-phosphate isomerase|nr:S-methyl-5-thioribose-1-phosphate isomerase [Bacteroidales bacterium]
MTIDGENYRSIWIDDDDRSVVRVIDQQKLPFYFETKSLYSVDDVYNAIKDMTVRGAPLIGAAGAFGIYLATLEVSPLTNTASHLKNAADYLVSCRPTAVNLSWAVNFVMERLRGIDETAELQEAALESALEICETEAENCRLIGENGLSLIREAVAGKNGRAVNILTHCNAGWLACIDYGTATAPVYMAHEEGIPVHVWVDETRPRNQGSMLTAWELGKAGVPYTLITDNAGGLLMQKGMVDLVFTGCDRATRRGDVANKAGTYLKALAARDNNVPFYALMPSSSIDFGLFDGKKEIIIEERDSEEVTSVRGLYHGEIIPVRICPEGTQAGNWGFDITPSELVTGFITERGICNADEKSIEEMFSDKIK